MRCDDAVAILVSLDHDPGHSGFAGKTGASGSKSRTIGKPRRMPPGHAVFAGRVAYECFRNGMPVGAAIRSAATAFGQPREIVAMHFGRARALRRGPVRLR